jgi:hydroxymethylbilane synthase
MTDIQPITSLIIATRASKLALWQSEHIAARLRELHPHITVTLLPMSTKGDEILDRSLSKIGGKGLFIKELETALQDGRAHLAVHSLKDLPVDLDPQFSLAAVTKREDPRDALVGCADLALLPAGSVVGTSSLRRAAQILRDFPTLKIEPLRGNLDTRLGKLDSGQYSAIVLAASGLKRLGYGARIAALLAPETMLPAAGQGALGIECMASRPDVAALLAPLACMDSTAATQAERAVGLALGASCSTPLAAHSWLDNGIRKLGVWAGSSDGQQQCGGIYELQIHETPQQLGARAGHALIAQGALQLIIT